MMLSKHYGRYLYLNRYVLYLCSIFVLITLFGCKKSDQQRIRQIIRIEDEYIISVKKTISKGDCYVIFFETNEETYQKIRTMHQWLPLSTDRAFEMSPGSYIDGLQGSYVRVDYGHIGLTYIVLLDDNKTILTIRCGAFW